MGLYKNSQDLNFNLFVMMLEGNLIYSLYDETSDQFGYVFEMLQL